MGFEKAFFTVRDIPLAAYEYVVNGKPAEEWVMERQAVTTDTETMKIVRTLPMLFAGQRGTPRAPRQSGP